MPASCLLPPSAYGPFSNFDEGQLPLMLKARTGPWNTISAPMEADFRLGTG